MPEIKLKRCPFCGGEAELYRVPFAKYDIECKKCMLTSKWFDDAEEAAEAWNRRADGWHKWPEEKPKERGLYMITEGCGDTKQIKEALYYNESDKWLAADGAIPGEHVMAWREMPEPWEEAIVAIE